jgi:hypothetical protein
MAMVALGLGFVVVPADRQREEVRHVKATGGSVRYDYQVRWSEAIDRRLASDDELDLPLMWPPQPPGPAWLWNTVGVDFVAEPTEVVFLLGGVTDADLAATGRLKRLQRIDLWLPGLCGTASCSRRMQRVTDDGLAHLTGLEHLVELNLTAASINGSGLVHLRGLKRLAVLKLSGTLTNDSVLRHLAHMPALSELYLDCTPITDAGLAHLVRMKNLRRLHLSWTDVSDQGIATLQQALPKCEIVREIYASGGYQRGFVGIDPDDWIANGIEDADAVENVALQVSDAAAD